MNQPRRQCIFCDGLIGRGSKEHVWSQWMHDLLEGKPSGKYNRHTITRWPNGREETTGPTGKPGNVFDIQVRAVCGDCNSGWMNRREGEVRPFLEPMIKGEPITLTPLQVETLAKWCAHKFIVMEHAAHDTSLTPWEDRVALREHGTIPDYFRIYIGNHASKHRAISVRHSHTLALSLAGPSPPLDGTSRNIQTITILMGRLFIHLNAARVDGFEIESRYLIPRVWNECRIWPNPNAASTWPHRPLLDDSGLSMVANTLDTLTESHKAAGKAFWIEGFPRR